MSKAERQEMVETLTATFSGASTIYVTDFTGMNVARMTEFRRRLRAAGAKYVVVKNTLAERALEANRITDLASHLTGAVGLVLAGDDPLPAAKVITDFAKEFENRPAVKAGYVEGKAVAAEYVKRLGTLPSREELLGQFAGALNGVLYQVIGALEALKEQRQAAAS